MALIVWLPLNGNINNQGLSQLTSSGTPTYLDNGKMGKCISLAPRVTFNGLPQLNNFTIAYWLKVDACTSDWADNLGFKSVQADGSSASDFRFEATISTRACSFHNNSPYAISTGSRILITEAQKGEWHHCCVSYNGSNLYTYIDGILTYTDTGLGGYLIDRFHIGEGAMTGGMNDLRIYDECLSDNDIYNISKGLVAHYPLRSVGASNLATNSYTTSPGGFYDYTGKASASRISDSGVCTKAYKIDFPEDSETYTNYNLYTTIGRDSSAVKQDGNTYTLSFKIKASKKLTNYKLYYEFNNASINTDIETYWKKITLTGNANNQYSALYLCQTSINRAKINGGSIYIAEVKLERGNIATPWLPHASESVYTQLGYDKISLKDVSGNGHNAVASSIGSYTSNAVKYNSSLSFDGSANFIAIGRPMPRDEITANVWAYMEDWSLFSTNGMRLASCTEGGGWNFEPISGGMNFALGVGSSSNDYMVNFTSSAINLSTLSSGWHMFTGTFDGVNKKIYLDGELKGTINTTQSGSTLTTKTPIFYNSANGIFIGAEAAGTTTTPAGNYFSGSMSDFRIYATAFSENEVKTLYSISALTNSSGNLYAYEFIEEES